MYRAVSQLKHRKTSIKFNFLSKHSVLPEQSHFLVYHKTGLTSLPIKSICFRCIFLLPLKRNKTLELLLMHFTSYFNHYFLCPFSCLVFSSVTLQFPHDLGDRELTEAMPTHTSTCSSTLHPTTSQQEPDIRVKNTGTRGSDFAAGCTGLWQAP